MKKEELNQLNDLKAEINELADKISYLRTQKIGTATDKVRASYKNFPYIEGMVRIEGFDETALLHREAIIKSKEELQTKRMKRAQQLETAIMEYITTVNDSRVRRAMEYRYIEGYKWEKIARIMHCDRTYPEKIIKKYLEKEV